MRRVFNFSAGPAMLPEEVLLQAQAEMLDWQGTGMSIMELGHRGSEFKVVFEECEATLRELMEIPKNYKVLMVAGGASTQFAMVPLNLFNRRQKADYVDTGIWSKKAIAEAKRYGQVNVVTEIEKVNDLLQIPDQNQWSLQGEAAYVHYTPNETIDGIQFHWVPKTGDVPLVADMTSMILSRPVDVNDYGIIYAGAQKNMGAAGITLVIIREDLIQEALPYTPTLYNYKINADNQSLYNTPPTYNWYLMGLVFNWLKRQGGVKVIAERNRQKSQKIYGIVDQYHDFYFNTIHPSCRSIMNVVFSLRNAELTPEFLNTALEAGLTNLRGHRLSGGVRASIYNAMPSEGVDRLVDVMVDFAKRYG